MKNDDLKTTSSDPIWWEMLVFRGLNIIMVSQENTLSFIICHSKNVKC